MRPLLCVLTLLSHITFFGATLPPDLHAMELAFETFEGNALLIFPQDWSALKDQETANKIYRVAEENGNRFLHAYSERQGILVGRSHIFSAKEFPFLRWRWRVKQLPVGGNESTAPLNDSAAGVYIVYGSRLLPRAVKYAWSTTLPIGTRVTNPSYWRAKIVILRTGTNDLGTWHQETVNLYRDYTELFGAEPGDAQGIAVITSSDSTSSIAEADYDDFMLLSEEAALGREAHDLGN